MYMPLCGEELEVPSYTGPRERGPIPQTAKQDWRDSDASAALWGGARSAIVHGTPHGLSLSARRPSKTGVTGVYLPLCGEEPEVQSYLSPPTARPYPPNGRGRTGGTRVCLPLCGEELHVQSYRTPTTRRPYPPNRPGRTGGIRLYLPLCGEELQVPSHPTPPWTIRIPQTAQAVAGGLRCNRRWVEGN